MPDQQISQAYCAVLLRLYTLGWDAVLDADTELPDEFMPKEYFEHMARLAAQKPSGVAVE